MPIDRAGAAVKSRSSVVWALRAARREFLDYRFDYPVEAVEKASVPGSLHYYVSSDRLWLDNLEPDRDGVAMKFYRVHGYQYNPLFVAWWGLVHLQRHLERPDERHLQTFFTQIQWLKSQAVVRPDGAVVWPCYFDWLEGRCLLRSPWISAMYQGVAISALIRAHRMTGDRELLTLCESGARVFEKAVLDGGVRTVESGKVLYEEYPGYPLARVLDGFLFSLLGLYDLYSETRHVHWLDLFNEGIAGLVANVDLWDYRNKWSWYGSHGYLCPPHYHKLNYLLLRILGNLAGEKSLTRRAELWDGRTKGLLDKIEIYLVYLVTQNAARIRLPRP
jgi:heparosan-N-sulfate-glucuronate 5-epimerase